MVKFVRKLLKSSF